MLDDGLCTPDGATLARLVRDLARQARRVLTRPVADEAAMRSLCEAIDALERRIEPGTSKELGRWLASLRRRVEGGLPMSV